MLTFAILIFLVILICVLLGTYMNRMDSLGKEGPVIYTHTKREVTWESK